MGSIDCRDLYHYCHVTVGLSGSQTGVRYRPLVDGLPIPGFVDIPGNGLPLTMGSFNIPGTYYIEGANILTGCAVIMNETVTVTLLEAPQVDAGPDQSCLFGTGITMAPFVAGGSLPYTYLWSPPDGLSNPFILNPLANPTDTTTYLFEVTDFHGCKGRDTITINPFVPAGQSIALGRVTYGNTALTPLHGIPVYLKTPAGTIVQTTTTSTAGEYQFLPFADGDYWLTASSTQAVGGVNSTDALAALKHFVHMITLTGINLKAADVDGSNYVNAVDALAIQRFFVGLLTSFPAGPWVFEKVPVNFYSSIYIVDFKGLCTGDINASYTPYAKQEGVFRYSTIGKVDAVPGSQVDIPVTINSKEDAGALSIDIAFDGGVFQPEEIVFPNQDKGWIWNLENNRLRLSFVSVDPLRTSPENPVFILRGMAGDPGNGKNWIQGMTGEISDPEGNIADATLHLPEIQLFQPGDHPAVTLYPNPATSTVNFSYNLTGTATVKMELYSPQGSLVMEKAFHHTSAGYYKQEFSLNGLDPGIYLVKFITTQNGRSTTSTNKVVVIR
ncbi:MAG: T9SS type A sorting domain-containing protein [Bacteroidetes bacterium]|nr:T9SS type A sorting domain-containing protein [Bacteroidota bacterium]